jgi:integrase
MQRQRRAEAIWIDKENRWCVQVQSNGLRRRFYSTTVGKRGKVEAERKADEWLSLESPVGNAKVSTVFKSWIEYLKEEQIYTHQYDSIGNAYIIPLLGYKRIDAVTEFDLQKILTLGFNKGLARKSLENIRGCMSTFLKYCRMRRLTTLHPENLKINKKAPKPQKRTMQPHELRVLFSEDNTVWKGKVCFDWYIFAYRFEVSTGLRPSELLGLRRTDVNEDNRTVTISRPYLGRGKFSDGKTDNALRTIVMNDYAMQAYKDQLEMLAQNHLPKTKCPWLFPDRNGKIAEQKTVWQNFQRYCEYNGIPLYSLYELRHTYISVNRYMPESLLKLQVGHSEKMDTRGVYGHEIDGDAIKAAEFSRSAFAEILEQK